MNTVIRMTFMTVILLWVIFAIAFPLCRFKSLENEDVKDRFSSLYDQIRTTSKLSALYTAVFCIRRMLMVVIYLVYEEDPVSMLFAFMLLFTVNFIYLVHARANL